uniref:Protein-lysine N-methyltransferase CG9643 n=1 Tax=Drosophila melanogaster TaxID=7227 RepID=Q9VQJ8_DROME|eukprot:NP_001285572.1 uncharacterized protein Dmel_CG9643, isoform B [Drosophila melanogaster]
MDSELNGSELGTKEFWESSYNREIRNYKSHGDVGEIWFDESAQWRTIDWLLNEEKIDKEASRVLDLGCGNGMFLVGLANEGFTGDLTGVDYSPKAVELAQNIAEDNKLSITYKVADLTQPQNELGQFDVVHDKGTYDAVSLCPDNAKEKRALYLDTVEKLLRTADSLFVITSCNWTEDELVDSFAEKFVKYYTIPTPTFKFGGKVGNVVTSIVFKRKKE